MDIVQLEKAYSLAESGKNLSEKERVKRNMHFVKLLLSDNQPEIINFHYEILKKRDYKELYYDLRAAFKKRPMVEKFLFKKLKCENDPISQADILHLLGGMRSLHAAPIAREFIGHDYDYHREVAMYVLGWVGGKEDISALQEHMLYEQNPRMRITAASAHRQIAWRHNDLKESVLLSLRIGFENEKDNEVLSWIIVIIGTVATKRLGLWEDKDDPNVLHGNLEKAKKKTMAFLASLSSGKK